MEMFGKYIIEITDAHKSNDKYGGETLYSAKNFPYVQFTKDQLECLKRYNEKQLDALMEWALTKAYMEGYEECKARVMEFIEGFKGEKPKYSGGL